MSREIDEHIVEMQFNNREFERGVSQSMTTLDKFKQSLDFTGAEKSFQKIEDASKEVTLSSLTKSAEVVEAKFSAMSIVAITAISRITDAAMTAGTNLVKSMSIDQVTAGFNKLEEKTRSVRTIMSATGKSVEEVNEYMAKLNWFTDETSYSMTDMTSNIAKFVSNKIPLEDSVTAMQGIATWAAAAGQGVNEASRAMYNISQAMGVGALKLVDFKSIENANMATAEFKETAMEAAVALGRLVKVNGKYLTAAKKTEVTVSNFRETLNEDWLDKDVLLKTLSEYGSYADAVYDVWKEGGVQTSKVMKKLGDAGLELGYKAFKAAQEYRTFADAISATKDAVSSGWMKTFEILFGNADEVVTLWTGLGEALWDIFASGAESRNEMLSEWKELGGRKVLIDTIATAWENLGNVIDVVKQSFRELFPAMDAEGLKALTDRLYDFVSSLKLSNKALSTLGVIVKLVLIPVKMFVETMKLGLSIIGAFVRITFALADAFLFLLSDSSKVEGIFRKLFGDERYERIAAAFSTTIQNLTVLFNGIFKAIQSIFSQDKDVESSISNWKTLLDILGVVGGIVLDAIVLAFETLAKLDFSWMTNFVDGIGKFINSLDVGSISILLFVGVIAAAMLSLVGILKSAKWALEDFADGIRGIKLAQTSKTVLTFAAAIAVLILAFNSIKTDGLVERAAVLIGIYTSLIVAIRLLASGEKKMVKATSFMIAFSLAVKLLVSAFNKINPDDILVKATILFSIVAALTAVTNILASQQKRVVKGTAFLIAFGLCIKLLVSAFNSINPSNVLVQSGVLLGIIVAVAAVLKLMASQEKYAIKGTAFLIAFGLCIKLLVSTFNSINPSDALVKIGVLASIIAAIVITMKLLSLNEKTAIKGSTFLIAFGLCVKLLSSSLNSLDTTDILAKVATLAAIMTGLVASMIILSKNQDAVVKGSLFLLSFGVAINLLTKSLNNMNMSDFGMKAVVLVGIMTALVMAMKALSSAEKTVVKGSAFLIAFGVAIGILVSAFNRIDTTDILAKVLGLSAITAALLSAALVMKAIGTVDLKSVLVSFVAISAILWELVGIFTIMQKMDAYETIMNAQSLSMALLAISAVIAVLSIFPVNLTSALQGIASVSVLILALGALMGVIGWLMTLGEVSTFLNNGGDFLKLLGSLTPTILGLLVVSAACALLGNTGPTAIIGFGVLAAIIAALGVFLVAAGAIMDDPDVKRFVDNGVEFFGKIGEGIGSFIGGIVSGIAKKATSALPVIGENLSSFMTNAEAFVTGIDKIDQEKISTITNFASAIVSLTNATYGAGTLSSFAQELSAFAPPFKEFCEQIGQIDNLDVVTSASIAAKTLAEFAASLPAENGKLQDFLGSHSSMEKFGADLVAFGKAFVEYAKVLKDGEINYSIVASTSNAAKSIAEFANSLPSSDGALQDFLGNKDMAKFGEDLVVFGKSFAEYYKVITEDGGIESDVVVSSMNAAKAISEFSKSLPSSDGILQDFLGNKDMAKFGEDLVVFGNAFANYYSAITSNGGINAAVVNSSAMAASALAELANNLPSSGGWVQTIFGGKSLDGFGEQLGYFGRGIKQYADEVAGVSPDDLEASAKAVETFVNISKNLNSTGGLSGLMDSKDLGKFGEQIANVGGSLRAFDSSIENVTWSRFNTAMKSLKDFVDLASNIKLVDTVAIGNFRSSLQNLASSGIDGFTEKFENSSDKVKNAGETLVRGINEAVQNKRTTLQKTGKTIGEDVVSSMSKSFEIRNSRSKRTAEISKYAIMGLEKGLLENEHISNNAASNVAEHMLQAMKDTLEIHSPSYRVRQEVAKNIIDAIPAEFDENDDAEKAAKAKAEAIVQAFSAGLQEFSDNRSILDLERQLHELKLPSTLSDDEKTAAMAQYDIEQRQKYLETYVGEYKLAVAEWQYFRDKYGEESQYTKDAQLKLMKQEIELRKYAAEMATATNQEIKNARSASIQGYKDLYAFMNSDVADKLIQQNIKDFLKTDENYYYELLGEEYLSAPKEIFEEAFNNLRESQYKAFEESIKDGSWKMAFKDLESKFARELFSEYESEYVSQFNEDLRFADSVDADALVNSLLGGYNIDEFKDVIQETELTDAFIQAVEDSLKETTKSASSAGKDAALAYGGGFGDGMDKDAGKEIEEAAKKALGAGGDGEDSLDQFIPSAGSIASWFDNLTNDANGFIDGLFSKAKEALSSGVDTVLGFIQGVDNKLPEVEDAGRRTGRRYKSAVETYLDINSPSRVMEKDGEYAVDGFIIGMLNKIAALELAAGQIGDVVSDVPMAFSEPMLNVGAAATMAEEINDTIESTHPVITPVLDLTTVNEQINDLKSDMSSRLAAQVSASMAPSTPINQNGSATPAASTTAPITFNQYNTSPKALDRLEIYRQTNNQLSVLKEGLKKR